ncbi:hypothetical protein B0A55_13013 [Friedmanniomyces simplex]|uniref:BTB domain-containing protein n=1 Tax=Friedmanniomyces simplex TaxID=329884 RepID=A0A4U0W4Z0_9PEZI|nr:hypothetical protein B0A55_13013 [Friedmanniomyces simplex]
MSNRNYQEMLTTKPLEPADYIEVPTDSFMPFDYLTNSDTDADNADLPSARRWAWLERLSVTVLVGEDGHSFSVHEGLLCENSPFFTSAMKKEWAEGQKREIPLPDDKPEVFNLYAEWKYTGKLLSRLSPSDSGSNGGELTLLIDAYVFGEKVQDRDFQDATLDALIMSTNTQDQEGKKWFPSGAVVRRAYRGTLAGSPIRRLLVDMHNHNGGENWIKEENDEEFLVDLVREMYASRARPQQADPTRANVNSCSYHHHTEDRLCYDHTAARRWLLRVLVGTNDERKGQERI